MTILVSPDILAYTIGKGIVSFAPDGVSPQTFRDMGNAPVFEITPKLDTLEHQSSRSGTKVTDKTVVISKKMELKLVLDEWTLENLRLAVLGEFLAGASPANTVIDIFQNNAISGAIKCVGTNEVGPKYTWELYRVDFLPSSALGIITDEWGQIELTGTVGANELGKFGRITATNQ